jgi:hypothetical protein
LCATCHLSQPCEEARLAIAFCNSANSIASVKLPSAGFSMERTRPQIDRDRDPVAHARVSDPGVRLRGAAGAAPNTMLVSVS